MLRYNQNGNIIISYFYCLSTWSQRTSNHLLLYCDGLQNYEIFIERIWINNEKVDFFFQFIADWGTYTTGVVTKWNWIFLLNTKCKRFGHRFVTWLSPILFLNLLLHLCVSSVSPGSSAALTLILLSHTLPMRQWGSDSQFLSRILI